MPRLAAQLFGRYKFQSLQGAQMLSSSEQLTMLQDMRGRLVPHRKSTENEDDADTLLMRPHITEHSDCEVLTWYVARYLGWREKTTYEARSDRIEEIAEDTDEIQYTRFVAVPSLGVFAVDGRTSERLLGPRAAVARLRSIIKRLGNGLDFVVDFTGTDADVSSALENWALDEVRFTVRPFNPSPARPGKKMHDLMMSDGVGQFAGVVKPAGEARMQDSHAGLLSEIKGLSAAGYGQISAKGTMPSGQTARFEKPKFSQNRDANRVSQSQPRRLVVYIDLPPEESDQISAIAGALIEQYGRRD